MEEKELYFSLEQKLSALELTYKKLTECEGVLGDMRSGYLLGLLDDDTYNLLNKLKSNINDAEEYIIHRIKDLYSEYNKKIQVTSEEIHVNSQ